MILTEMSKSELQRVTSLITNQVWNKVQINLHFTNHALERATDGNIDKNGNNRGESVTKDNLLEHWTHILASIPRIVDIYVDAKTGKLPTHMFNVEYNNKGISEETYGYLVDRAEAINNKREIDGDPDPKFQFIFKLVFKDLFNGINTAANITITEDYKGDIKDTSMVVKTMMVIDKFLHDSSQISISVPSNKGSAASKHIDEYIEKYKDLIKKYHETHVEDQEGRDEVINAIAKHSTDMSKSHGMHLLDLS